ncbi:Protein STRUBBELIG-RECEPTOR FAMILY 5 [Senna tora]|uniref:Protein STRUBBELIG-RECEPTOR FAMILY 5 n=1 Tax=Senna tora TaxID=362788 RepID=A0A834XEH0_9FABA|nr:Protein STRUBBELIG-RECEPTOR FAMILY 5 [Senna tora]
MCCSCESDCSIFISDVVAILYLDSAYCLFEFVLSQKLKSPEKVGTRKKDVDAEIKHLSKGIRPVNSSNITTPKLYTSLFKECHVHMEEKRNIAAPSKKKYMFTYSTARAVPSAILTLVFHVSGLLKSSDKCRNS